MSFVYFLAFPFPFSFLFSFVVVVVISTIHNRIYIYIYEKKGENGMLTQLYKQARENKHQAKVRKQIIPIEFIV